MVNKMNGTKKKSELEKHLTNRVRTWIFEKKETEKKRKKEKRTSKQEAKTKVKRSTPPQSQSWEFAIAMLTAMVEAERVLWLAVCDIEINVPESSGISSSEDKSSTGGVCCIQLRCGFLCLQGKDWVSHILKARERWLVKCPPWRLTCRLLLQRHAGAPHAKPKRSMQETRPPIPRHSLQSPPLLTVTDHRSKEAEWNLIMLQNSVCWKYCIPGEGPVGWRILLEYICGLKNCHG